MNKLAKTINEVVTSNDVVSFDVVDAKGRAIGSQIKRIEADWVDAAEGAGYGYRTDRRGHWFAFEPHATRDGKRYGAYQGPRWFATVEDREAAIVEYLVQARKRAAKIK